MSDYWYVPEDITRQWASMREHLERAAQGNGRKLMTFHVFVTRGIYDGHIIGPSSGLEPRSVDLDWPPCTWWTVIRRVRSEATLDFVGFIKIDVFLTQNEQPALWTAPVKLPYSDNRKTH